MRAVISAAHCYQLPNEVRFKCSQRLWCQSPRPCPCLASGNSARTTCMLMLRVLFLMLSGPCEYSEKCAFSPCEYSVPSRRGLSLSDAYSGGFMCYRAFQSLSTQTEPYNSVVFWWHRVTATCALLCISHKRMPNERHGASNLCFRMELSQ